MTTKQEGHRRLAGRLGALMAALLLHDLPSQAASAALPEPSTVLYGRILGTGSSQPFPVREGTLEWWIRTADGRELKLTAPVRPLRDSDLSYRLSVPHFALAPGLAAGTPGVGLKPTPERHQHARILVNGIAATISGASEASFESDQLHRAATYRLDLEVPLAPPDADGDGLPDWWQKEHGLTGGATADPDGDGLSNGGEFRLGSDPNQHNRRPTLLTRELLAYADGTTGVPLDALDADTEAAQLRYTFVRVPAPGSLRLRNAIPSATAPDQELSAGSQFTQADVLEGRLVFVHSGDSIDPVSLEITLDDGTPGGEPTAATVRITPFRPAAALTTVPAGTPSIPVSLAGVARHSAGYEVDAARLIENYLLSRDAGFVIWDWSASRGQARVQAPSGSVDRTAYPAGYVARYGRDRQHVLMGGEGARALVGGMEADVLVAGPSGSMLQGNAGADRFFPGQGSQALDEVLDFSVAEGDVLDLSQLLRGSSGALGDYLRVSDEGGNAVIEVEADGVGGGYADRRIRLAGVRRSDVDLSAWIEGGTLNTGGPGLQPRVTVTAVRAEAAEGGAEPGGFLLTRTGDVREGLVVAVAVGGSAGNGSDYATLANRVTFAAGEKSVRLPVDPFADSQPEPTETVELVVLSGTGYEVGTPSRAVVGIEDWRPTLSITALEPYATSQPHKPGALRLTTSAPVDRAMEVLLVIAGSAEAGLHYQALRRVVTFLPGQSSVTLDVTPLAGALPSGGAATVDVSISEDPAYRLGSTHTARVLLVDRLESFAAWRSRHFPEDRSALGGAALTDPGAYGIPLVMRYVYGLDAKQPDRRGLPRTLVRDGYLTVDVPRRPAAADVQIVVETSENLVDWETSASRIQEFRPVGAAPDAGVVCYRTLPSIADAPRQFVRVRALYRP